MLFAIKKRFSEMFGLDLRSLALARVCFGLLLLFDLANRARSLVAHYTDAGFSPANLTVKVGDTVTFKNQSSADMWVASAMHPTHSVYNGTTLQQHCPDPENNDFDQCQSGGAGTSWSFTFTKAGSFGYHGLSAAFR